MPDPIPDPLPSSPTKPPLTAEMIVAAKDAGTPRPGAGGWVPSPGTVYAIGACATFFAAMVPVVPTLVPGHLGVGLAGTCGAIAGGCVFFATKSAGPRAAS